MNSTNRIFRTIAVCLVVTTVTASCAFDINLFGPKFQTGPTRTSDIQVPLLPDASSPAAVNLEFVAGKLLLSPGDSDYLVSGSALYNAVEFEPQIENAASSTTLRQGEYEVMSFKGCPDDVKNEWDLVLANVPLNLTIQAGAYDGDFELGGLSLLSLDISEGGSDVTCTFSNPNQVEMSSFTYQTGASHAQLYGLANANFTTMTFESGAGDFTLSFDGDLKRDAVVNIDSGLGTLNIIVPPGVNARVTVEEGLSTINVGSGWLVSGNIYTHEGSGLTITINITIGAGTLNLESS